MSDKPYALFGGIKPEQIVGGEGGLQKYPSYPNFLGTWALEGKGMLYDGKKLDEFA